MILMALIAAFALALVIVVILLALTAPPPRKDLLEAIEAMPRETPAEYDDYATGWQDGHRDCQADYDVHRFECQADRDKRDAEYWHGYNTGWMVAMQNRERK